MQSDKYIKSIEFQSVDFEIASVPDLQILIDKSIRLRMAVAFWTIRPEVVSYNLSGILGRSGSFACVDIHQPTNIDHICDLAEKGSNMFFHGKRINEKRKPDGPTPKLPTNLLHSKVLLFDVNDNEAELWVGSHNWTEYALGGINIETSLRIKMHKDSDLYADAENLLESICRQCSPVDPHLRETYRLIQESEYKVPSLTFRTHDEDLPSDAIIHIFGTELNDYKSLSSVGKKIYVTIQTPTQRELLFESTILITGYLPKANKGVGWTNLETGYWALHDGKLRAEYINPQSIPPESILKEKAFFWVSLRLENKCPEYLRLDPPAEVIPFYPIQSVGNLKMWKENHGWVHPDRTKPPTIEQIPFEILENYQSSSYKQRAILLYGENEKKYGKTDNQNDSLSTDMISDHRMLVEYDELQPLMRKLVLKGRER
jgi:hypothetical protein